MQETMACRKRKRVEERRQKRIRGEGATLLKSTSSCRELSS